jgi:hypothetical protein
MSAAENQDNTIISEKGQHHVGEHWAGGTVANISSIADQPAMEAVEVVDLTHSLKTRSAGNVELKLKAAFLALETGQTVSIGVNNATDSNLTGIEVDLDR